MSQALTADERAACAVCAAWLATSPAWALLAWAALAAAALGLAYGGALFPAALAAVLLIPERVLAVRVALDARLFSQLADGTLPGLAELDAGLQQVLQVPAAKSGRPLAPRIAGAKRLYRLHVICAVLLALLAVATWAF